MACWYYNLMYLMEGYLQKLWPWIGAPLTCLFLIYNQNMLFYNVTLHPNGYIHLTGSRRNINLTPSILIVSNIPDCNIIRKLRK